MIVGGFYKRKNVARVIEAYKILRDQSAESIPSLVVVGKHSDEYAEYVDHCNLTNSVIFTGYVEPDLMPHLYAGGFVVSFTV